MTKRDFELIADVINISRTGLEGASLDAVRIVATNMADALSATNPRFDRDRFLKACGFSKDGK